MPRFVLAWSLVAAALIQPACTETEIPGNVLFASNSAERGRSYLTIGGVFPEYRKFFYLRLNGRDAWRPGAQDSERVVVGNGYTGLWVPSGEYVVSLVDRQDRVVLTTERLVVSPHRMNSVVIYGDYTALSYMFHDIDPRDVPFGKFRFVTGNVGFDRSPAEVFDCGGDWNVRTDCKVVTPALAYGDAVEFETTYRRFLVVRRNDVEYIDWAFEDAIGARPNKVRAQLVHFLQPCDSSEGNCLRFLTVNDADFIPR